MTKVFSRYVYPSTDSSAARRPDHREVVPLAVHPFIFARAVAHRCHQPPLFLGMNLFTLCLLFLKPLELPPLAFASFCRCWVFFR